ncbi:MAG: helix-turn-helix domain-containing protein [Candidatus Hydrogenedentales bacterium]
MATVQLLLDDPAQALTLRTILEAGGFSVGSGSPDAVITDAPRRAIEVAHQRPTLIVCPAGGLRQAVDAMNQGVFGYIMTPFQPGEAAIMVTRALEWSGRDGTARTLGEELRPLRDVEREYIQHVLRQCKHNQAKAARILGIGRNTLWRKLKGAAPARAQERTR